MLKNSLLLPLSLLLSGLGQATAVSAESPVWQVDKDGRTIFLGGSVHFLDDSQYPLPSGFELAYSRAQVVVLEADLVKMQSPEYQSSAMARLLYPEPVSIRDRLEEDTIRALEAFFDERGLVLARVERFRPGLLTSTMLVIELQRLGLLGAGVDQFFQQRATADDKPLRYLETIGEQLDILAVLGAGEEDAVIRQSLADIERLPTFWDRMLAVWREGDLEQLHRLTAATMQSESPQTYRQLVTRRNQAWLEKFERMLTDAPIEFIVVGALHLGGEQGLLEMLAARGYRLRQLP